jgi:hypothetical protein
MASYKYLQFFNFLIYKRRQVSRISVLQNPTADDSTKVHEQRQDFKYQLHVKTIITLSLYHYRKTQHNSHSYESLPHSERTSFLQSLCPSLRPCLSFSLSLSLSLSGVRPALDSVFPPKLKTGAWPKRTTVAAHSLFIIQNAIENQLTVTMAKTDVYSCGDENSIDQYFVESSKYFHTKDMDQ